MRAHRVIGALVLALAGCGNAEPGMNDAINQVFGGLVSDAPARPVPPSYDQLVAQPYASVGLRLDSSPDAPIALLAATALLNGRVWYVDVNRRGVILEGGRVVGTRGMTQDLLGTRQWADDPLTVRTAPRDWPHETLVIQHARDGIGAEYSRAFRCTVTFNGIEDTELYQRTIPLARMTEDCIVGRASFRNDHWIDPQDGRMWKTRQWIGPSTGHVEVVVVRAFGD
jgi:hypothetical protein